MKESAKFTAKRLSREYKILVYHSIDEARDDPNGLNTSSKRLREHMKYLADRRIYGVSMRDLLEAIKNGDARKLIGLTFDDGYRDFHHTAVPILQEFGFTATVFALPDLLGGKNDWVHHYRPFVERDLMNERELWEVSQLGMEVGSHFSRHAVLTRITAEDLRNGLIRSLRDLETIVGCGEVKGFCYPYGILSAGVAGEVRAAGYEYACSLSETVDLPMFDIVRIPLRDKDDLRRFKIKLRAYFSVYKVRHIFGGVTGDERLWSES